VTSMKRLPQFLASTTRRINCRPKKILDTKRIAALRTKGVGWKRIAADMGVGVGTTIALP
jgi:hypothetical protein